jgi:hypothetical protein
MTRLGNTKTRLAIIAPTAILIAQFLALTAGPK